MGVEERLVMFARIPEEKMPGFLETCAFADGVGHERYGITSFEYDVLREYSSEILERVNRGLVAILNKLHDSAVVEIKDKPQDYDYARIMVLIDFLVERGVNEAEGVLLEMAESGIYFPKYDPSQIEADNPLAILGRDVISGLKTLGSQDLEFERLCLELITQETWPSLIYQSYYTLCCLNPENKSEYFDRFIHTIASDRNARQAMVALSDFTVSNVSENMPLLREWMTQEKDLRVVGKIAIKFEELMSHEGTDYHFLDTRSNPNLTSKLKLLYGLVYDPGEEDVFLDQKYVILNSEARQKLLGRKDELTKAGFECFWEKDLNDIDFRTQKIMQENGYFKDHHNNHVTFMRRSGVIYAISIGELATGVWAGLPYSYPIDAGSYKKSLAEIRRITGIEMEPLTYPRITEHPEYS